MFEEMLEQYNAKSAELQREQKKVREMIDLLTGMNKIAGYINSDKNDVVLLGRLIDQVDRFSRDLADVKSQLTTKQATARQPSYVQPAPSNMVRNDENRVINENRVNPIKSSRFKSSKTLDNRARALIRILKGRPGSYTNQDLTKMMGVNREMAWKAMIRAKELDPEHIKIVTGKQRSLHVSYIADGSAQVTQVTDDERMKRELMGMNREGARSTTEPTKVSAF